jgi:Peptidase S24-like
MATKATQKVPHHVPRRGSISSRSRATAVQANESAASDVIGAHADLIPGVRDRLILHLVALGVPADKRVSFLAGLTGCAAQTVRRWLADVDPGLPDLRSFATLCRELNIGADELMGSARGQGRSLGAIRSVLMDVARCVHDMAGALGGSGGSGEAVVVRGDEMAPRLREGDLAFVDRDSGMAGNGLYAFEYRGEMVIRRVEKRHGRSWLLKCDNKAYGDSEFDESDAAGRRGLCLVGKVRGTIAMRIYR